jgi:hypothetical protein
MCGCNSEAFMGVEMPNQSVYDVGATGLVSEPAMFETDSQDSLGTATELPLTSAPQVRMD